MDDFNKDYQPESDDDATLPAEPAKPAKPAEPAKPVEQDDTAASEQPAAPSASEQPAAPSASEQVVNGAPAQPDQPAPPTTAPVMPAQPAPPVSAYGQSEQPTQPASPYSQPASPYEQPTQPASPYSQPEQPTQPASPYSQPASPYSQPTSPYGQPASPYGTQPVADFYQPAAPVSGKATGALICGILAIVFAAIPILGLILGVVAVVLAGSAIKESGKNGKSTGAKVCGIIGIVFSLIITAAYITIVVTTVTYIEQNPETYSSEIVIDDSTGSIPSVDDNDATTEAMISAASAQMDLLKNKDPELAADLTAKVDKMFSDSMGYSLTDLGVAPEDFTEWMLTDLTYSVSDAYSYDDGTGTAYIEVTSRDFWSFSDLFIDEMDALTNSGELDSMDQAAALARIGELMKSSMERSTEMTDAFIGLDMVEENGKWTVDQDDWEEEVNMLFGLY